MAKKWGGQCPPGPPGFDATDKLTYIPISLEKSAPTITLDIGILESTYTNEG